MEEKYGIELELLTDAFNKKINQIKNYFSGIKNQEIDVKANTAQLSYIESQINDITDKIRRIDAGFETGDVLKLEAQLEKLRQQYQKLSEVEDEVGFKGTTAFNNMQKGINKVTSKMKRFAFSLFSIRSIYSLLSRASSAYISQDTALANKLQAVWIGLGAILEPVISAIANTLIKAVKYINIFIKALTGVDLLAKATAKSMGKTTKGAKALSKALAVFDDLNNLDTNADGGSSGIDTSWADAFDKVKLDPNLVETIEKIGTAMRSGWEWFTSNWKNIVLGVVAVVGAISLFKIIKSIISPVTSASQIFSGFFNSIGKAVQTIAILGGLAIIIKEITGLIKTFAESGLSLSDVALLLGTVLGELSIAFIVLVGATRLMNWKSIAGATVILAGFAIIINQVSKLLKVFSETGLTVKDVAGLMASIFVPLVALMGAVALIGPLMTAGLVPFSVVVVGIVALLIVMAETLPKILDACGKFINTTAPSIIALVNTISKAIDVIIRALGDVLPPIINSIGNLFSRIFNGISQVISTVGNTIVRILNTAKSLVTTVLSSILSFINNLGPAINNFVNNAIRAVTKLINFVVSGIEYLVNTLVVGGVNKIIKAINSISQYVGFRISTIGKMSIPRFVPRLDVGTNYVPQDQLAYIHKGEAVIPKKFNSQEYFGNGDEEIKSLLQQVIEKIEGIEINPYTTIKDVGQASLQFKRDKERQTGVNVFA